MWHDRDAPLDGQARAATALLRLLQECYGEAQAAEAQGAQLRDVGGVMAPLFTCTLNGRPIVKKNTKNLVGRGRFKRAIYSPRFVEWERHAAIELQSLLNAKWPVISCPLLGVFRFYFENRMAEADVSNLIEGPQDLLTKLQVIEDDRLFMKVTGEKFFGQAPRTEIEIYKYEEIEQQQKEIK